MPVRDLLSAASTQGAGPSDPYFYDVSLLLNGDGTNGAQNNTFLDSSSNNFTITRNGNTTQGSFSPYGNLWSNYFGGSSNLLTPSSASISNFSGDFTIEGWVFLNSATSYAVLIGGDGSNGWYVEYSSNRGFGAYDGSSFKSGSSSAVTGQWVHYAVTRASGTLRFFINGTNTATTTSSNFNYTQALGISAYSSGSSFINGYQSNVRINNTTALYTSNFTPSTTPLTAISGTTLLTCQSNRFIDNSSNAFAITVNGSPSVQRFSPFNPTAPYDTATIGGSGYFDGSGGYLSVPSNSAFNLGTGEFTIEFWMYLTAFPWYEMLVGRQNYGAGTGWGVWIKNDAGNALSVFLNAASTIIVGAVPPLNAWQHVAIVRNSSNVITIYQNGVATGSASVSSFTDSSTNLNIGANDGSSWNASYPVNGYMSNLRIVKGTAVYTSTFTPPTSPVTNITNTSLLTDFTNAGIPDLAEMNDLQTVGNAQVSTSVKKYGTGSLSFDGTNSQLNYLSPVFGSGDFTVECWVYFNSVSGDQAIFGINFNSNANSVSAVRVDISSGVFRFMGSTDGTNFYFFQATSTSPSTSTWYHLALVRNSGTVTFYVNGTSAGSVSSVPNTLYAGTGGSRIGNIVYSSNYYLNGYVDDFRITTGLARYTTTFTPPTAALPTY